MTKLQVITAAIGSVIGGDAPLANGAPCPVLAIAACYMDELREFTTDQLSEALAAAVSAAQAIDAGTSVDSAVSTAQTATPFAAEFVEAVIRTGAI